MRACPVWILPSSILAGSSAAAGTAFVGSAGNAGGLIGTDPAGYLTAATAPMQGGHDAAGICLAGADIPATLLQMDGTAGKKSEISGKIQIPLHDMAGFL